jgi:hypothetical protein
MSGVNFRITGTIELAAISTQVIAMYVSPDTNRRVLIREISVTVSDPLKNGGFLNVKFSRLDISGASGYSTLGVVAEDPNIQATISATAKQYVALAVQPTIVADMERKRINVNGGEFLWIAIREENKFALSGGNLTGVGKFHAGLVFITDAVSNGIFVDYTIYGES